MLFPREVTTDIFLEIVSGAGLWHTWPSVLMCLQHNSEHPLLEVARFWSVGTLD